MKRYRKGIINWKKEYTKVVYHDVKSYYHYGNNFFICRLKEQDNKYNYRLI